MKKYLTLFIIGSALLSGCSNASDNTKNSEVKTETPAPKALSAEDQKIINKHNEYVQKYSMEDKEVFQKHMREILPEVDKITDKRKRELLQMNIYMILNDYDKAHALNDKQLVEKPMTQHDLHLDVSYLHYKGKMSLRLIGAMTMWQRF